MDGSTSRAVDRASANTPDEATTLTCRTPALAGYPVRGSMMWWSSRREEGAAPSA